MKIQNEASIKELEAKIQNLQGYVISKEKSNTKTKEDLQKTIKNKEDKIESLLLKGNIIQKREHLKKIIMYYLNSDSVECIVYSKLPISVDYAMYYSVVAPNLGNVIYASKTYVDLMAEEDIIIKTKV